MDFRIGDHILKSRMLLGTALYPSLDIMQKAIKISESEIVTLFLKRQTLDITASNTF